MSFTISFFLMAAGLWSFSSCSQNTKHSVFIIAVDHLPFTSFSCSESQHDSNSGLNTLCQESVRFTNAYTSSIHSAAAMGSLLTGLYPYRHGLHRSVDRITKNANLAQEFFKDEGYRTSFFSSKASILKKTGLSRGFDFFDDFSFLNDKNFSINLNEQMTDFMNWQSESEKPFFSIIYNSDLESLNEGESQISSIEEFDLNLGKVFSKLKKHNLWETSYVLVVGLQGRSLFNRPEESLISNLHSENTSVAVFIKPPRQKGDEGVHWKVDSPISIADIGYSLIRSVCPSFAFNAEVPFSAIDVSSLWLNSALPETDEDRRILIETANTWTRDLELRFAVVYSNSIFLDGESPKLFNRLTDGLETINLFDEQKLNLGSSLNDLAQIRASISARVWNQYLIADYKFVELNRQYWSSPNSRASLFNKNYQLLSKSNNKLLAPLSLLMKHFNEPSLSADEGYQIARRQSYNIAMENIWGLWLEN